MNKDDVLKAAGEPAYWMTRESQWRLSNGGNCKGAVPVHAKRSSTAIVALYTEAQLLAMYAKGAEDMRERAANRCNKLAMKHHQVDSTYAAGKKFGAIECEVNIRALPITPTNTAKYPACKGKNCGCTDGVNHSPECQAEHDAAIGYTPTNTEGERDGQA